MQTPQAQQKKLYDNTYSESVSAEEMNCKKFKRNGFIAFVVATVIIMFLNYIAIESTYKVTIFYLLILLLYILILGRSRCRKAKKK